MGGMTVEPGRGKRSLAMDFYCRWIHPGRVNLLAYCADCIGYTKMAGHINYDCWPVDGADIHGHWNPGSTVRGNIRAQRAVAMETHRRLFACMSAGAGWNWRTHLAYISKAIRSYFYAGIGYGVNG